MGDSIRTTPGAKMVYLIRRADGTSRDELIAHWYGNHMRGVIQGQRDAAAAGKPHAHKYLVTLFGNEQGNLGTRQSWDGMAQLWWDEPLAKPPPGREWKPRDTFQEHVEPYVVWAATEHVVIDGSENLPVEPLTLNDPFPASRSGFYKVTFLVKRKPGVDWSEFYAAWLEDHAPNVRNVMNDIGGFRYVVSHSIDPDDEPYAGMAELYFPDPSGWDRYGETITPDAFGPMVDRESITWFGSDTQLIGIA